MNQTDQQAQFWNRLAQKYSTNPVEDVPAYERTLEATRAFLSPDKDVFEFGCGTGSTALKLAAASRSIVATDFSDAMVAIADGKARAAGVTNVEFAVARPETYATNAAFDVAIGFNILHLIPDPETAIGAMHRLLKPGGYFITKTPCMVESGPVVRAVIPVMRFLGRAPYVGFFSAPALEQQIANAGFEIVLNERHGTKGKDTRPFIVARKT